MISKYNHKELNWVDLESPKEEEINHIIEGYPIPSFIKEKINNKENENIFDINDDFIYLSIKGKIVFFVNDKIILSIHEKPLQMITSFSQKMELDIIGDKKIYTNKLLFIHLLENLFIYDDLEIKEKEEKIKTLKNQILKSNKKIKKLKFFIIILIILSIIFIWL